MSRPAPALFLSDDDFVRAVMKADSGAVICYHVGQLATDRLFSTEVDKIATRALVLATPRTRLVWENQGVFGEGAGELYQRRLGEHRYEYYFIRGDSRWKT